MMIVKIHFSPYAVSILYGLCDQVYILYLYSELDSARFSAFGWRHNIDPMNNNIRKIGLKIHIVIIYYYCIYI